MMVRTSNCKYIFVGLTARKLNLKVKKLKIGKYICYRI